MPEGNGEPRRVLQHPFGGGPVTEHRVISGPQQRGPQLGLPGYAPRYRDVDAPVLPPPFARAQPVLDEIPGQASLESLIQGDDTLLMLEDLRDVARGFWCHAIERPAWYQGQENKSSRLWITRPICPWPVDSELPRPAMPAKLRAPSRWCTMSGWRTLWSRCRKRGGSLRALYAP